jgi:hypothetical protein
VETKFHRVCKEVEVAHFLASVLFIFQGQHNPGRGKGQCLYHVIKEIKERGLLYAINPDASRFPEESMPEGQAGNCESPRRKIIGLYKKPYSGKPNVRTNKRKMRGSWR